jgi:hypothetical protein
MSFAGTGSGLSGSGVGAAQAGVGGNGPSAGGGNAAEAPKSDLDIARDAYAAAYNKLQEAGPVSPLTQAGLIAQFTKITPDVYTTKNKNGEEVEHTDQKFTISPSDLTGQPLNRQMLKALDTVGLGSVYGVNGNYNQSAENVIASQNVNTALEAAVNIAKNLVPGFGVMSFAANVLSGKTTPGQALAGLLGDKVSAALGVPPSMFQAAFNGNYGNGLAGWATSALNSYVAKETKMDPRLTAMAFNTTGLPSLAKTSLSSLNAGPNFAGITAGAIDSGLSSLGIGNGPATTTGNVPNVGMDAESRANDILNPNNISPIPAPVSLDDSSAPPAVPTTPLSSAGTSSGPYAGALSNVATSRPTDGVYRIGSTNYTPYSQDLDQLDLAADEFTKPSDIGNIPMYNTDISKMASLPFTQSNNPYAQYNDPYAQSNNPYAQYNDPFTQYAAAGGSIRHFDRGGDVAPTAEQLEQRAELQARAQYYKNLDSQKQNADIMSALKNLSGVGAEAEAKPQSSPLIRLGQIGNYTPPKVLPQLAALLQARGMRLAEGGQPDDHKHPNYDGAPVFRTGGLSGLGGKYVEGKGNGTSDDITAMLADGEYVFSADVVSALGNGSNKAGAQVLDKTVEAIRSRARSAPPDKLPPDAKSPLEYMQAVKGKKYG